VTPTALVLSGPGPRLFVLGGRAVLVERGKGLTELGAPAGTHPLAVAQVRRSGSADALALVDEAGGIYRYAPGRAPQVCWRVRAAPQRLTVTTLAEDQVLIATYGRVWRRVELIQAGRRRWRRWGIPDLMPAADPDRLLTSWRRYSLLDGPAGRRSPPRPEHPLSVALPEERERLGRAWGTEAFGGAG